MNLSLCPFSFSLLLAYQSLLKLSSTELQNLISTSPITIQNSSLFSNVTELSVDCMLCACSYLHIESPSPLPHSCTDVTSMKPSWTPFLVPEHSYTFMSRWTWAFKTLIFLSCLSHEIVNLFISWPREPFELWYELNGTPCLQVFQVWWYKCNLFVYQFMYSLDYFIKMVFELYS